MTVMRRANSLVSRWDRNSPVNNHLFIQSPFRWSPITIKTGPPISGFAASLHDSPIIFLEGKLILHFGGRDVKNGEWNYSAILEPTVPSMLDMDNTLCCC